MVLKRKYVKYICFTLANAVCSQLRDLLSSLELNYIIGLVLLQCYTGIFHNVIFGPERLQFLPLMATSLYCSLGIVYGWGYFMLNYLLS